jgi:hypothetical protein
MRLSTLVCICGYFVLGLAWTAATNAVCFLSVLLDCHDFVIFFLKATNIAKHSIV